MKFNAFNTVEQMIIATVRGNPHPGHLPRGEGEERGRRVGASGSALQSQMTQSVGLCNLFFWSKREGLTLMDRV
jgi:hypothetical protein